MATGACASRERINRTAVWIFIGLAFALSWPLLLYGFGWFSPGEDVLERYVFSCSGMVMVALSAFLTRACVERTGFRDVGWHVGRCKWYVAALLFSTLLWLGPPLVALSLGKLEWNYHLTPGERQVVILSLVGVSVLAGLGEEFGWRGYLLPRLLLDRKLARLVLLEIGVIWGVWHCAVALGPLLRATLDDAASWPSMIGSTFVSCVQVVGASVALSFIFGAVWLRTHSIFLVSVLHGCWIGIRDVTSHLWSYPSVFRLITLAAVLAAWFGAVLWLNRYQLEPLDAQA